MNMPEKKSPACRRDADPSEAEVGGADFTPEQWAWIQADAKKWEDGYVPTQSLFPDDGL